MNAVSFEPAGYFEHGWESAGETGLRCFTGGLFVNFMKTYSGIYRVDS